MFIRKRNTVCICIHTSQVSKHVAVLSELARLVEVYGLLDVSQLEQELACNDEHALQQVSYHLILQSVCRLRAILHVIILCNGSIAGAVMMIVHNMHCNRLAASAYADTSVYYEHPVYNDFM
jgi:hypothetical protein